MQTTWTRAPPMWYHPELFPQPQHRHKNNTCFSARFCSFHHPRIPVGRYLCEIGSLLHCCYLLADIPGLVVWLAAWLVADFTSGPLGRGIANIQNMATFITLESTLKYWKIFHIYELNRGAFFFTTLSLCFSFRASPRGAKDVSRIVAPQWRGTWNNSSGAVPTYRPAWYIFFHLLAMQFSFIR